MNDIKTKELNSLFSEWENEVPGYKGRFVKDGIVDEALFEAAPVKILFVAKEPNDPGQKSWDYREWWQEELEYGFAYRIAEWSYGILNDFPQYDEIWGVDETVKERAMLAIRRIAFMNIKKTGGRGSAAYEEMNIHLAQNLRFLHRQIDIISPDIIIAGTTWQDLRNGLFGERGWVPGGYGIDICRYNNARVVDFYHPSSRNAPAAAYSLLQNIIRAEQFAKL